MTLSISPFTLRRFALASLVWLQVNISYGQDGVLIDYVGTTRDNSAVLDVRSTNQGFLAPRVLLTATDVAAPITSPANGLMVYNTNATGSGPTDVQPGYYYWNGTGWMRFQNGNSPSVIGSGAPTRVAFWDGTNSLSSDTELYWDNSVNKRLGVGTASPGRKLDVNGESRFRNTLYFGATDNEGLISWTSDMGNGEAGLVVRGQTGKGILMGANGGSHVMINNAGNVGIGTTGGPGQKLDVAGGSIRTTHQLMSTIATGTSPLQVASTTLNTNLNSDLLDGWHAHELQFQQSNRNFPNGTLIQTDIDYSVTSGEPWLLEIEGNSYGNLVPLDLKIQGYIYYDSLINVGGISNGTSITGLSAFNYGGYLCFWFPYQAYWQGYSIYVNDSYAGIKNNRLVSITHQAKPGGITKEVQLTPKIRQSWHSGNFTPSSYAPSTGGTGYIQNQVAADQAAGFRINGNGLFNGGSVGIGTPSPSTRLHINLGAGGANSTPALRIDGLSNYPSLELGIKGNYDGVIRTYGNDLHLYAGHWRTSGTSATENHNMSFYTSEVGSTNWETPKMFLQYDGNVGIGTTGPGAKLNVTELAGTFPVLRVNHDANSGETGIRFRTRSSGGSNAHADISWTATGNETGNLVFRVPYTDERMRIQSNGHVGIGTPAPVTKLEIEGSASNWNETTPGLAVGTIHLDPGTSSANIGNAITWGAHDTGNGDNGQAGIYVRSDGSYGTKMYFGTTSSYATGSKTQMMINDNGYVGLGTTGPARKLHVYGAASTYPARVGSPDGYLDFGPANTGYSHFSTDRPIFYFNTAVQVDGGLIGSFNQDLQLRTGNTTRITALNSTGNVGIGTSAPAQKLHVAGGTEIDAAAIEGNSTTRIFRNLVSKSWDGGQTGVLVIQTNVPQDQHTMIQTWINWKRAYSNGTTNNQIIASGYWSSEANGGFQGCGYTTQGGEILRIRFMRNSSTGNVAIVIGETTTTWSYPNISVTKMSAHYGIDDSYADGWTASFSTTLSGLINSDEVPNVTTAQSPGCRICLYYCDNNCGYTTHPNIRKRCTAMVSGSISPRLDLLGDVDDNDDMWIGFECD